MDKIEEIAQAFSRTDTVKFHTMDYYRSLAAIAVAVMNRPDYKIDISIKQDKGDRESDLNELFTSNEIIGIMHKYDITYELACRSLRVLIKSWYTKDKAGEISRPSLRRSRIRIACNWIRAGERTGKHSQWRREAPVDMGGVIPV